MTKYLFLDYDGVLHPSEVYRDLKTGRIYFKEGTQEEVRDCALFMHAEILADILDESGVDVKIILSTTWVRVLKSYTKALKRLPARLQERVIGSTYHSQIDSHLGVDPYASRYHGFASLTRFKQVYGNSLRRRLELHEWIALDDDAEGWPDEFASNLIKCHPTEALGRVDTQAHLRSVLSSWREELPLVGVEKP